MKKKIQIVLLFIFLFSLISACSDNDSVVINEIAWMGTTTSANDEWIELYNPNSSAVNMTDWILQAVDGKPKIILNGTISPRGYFLLERGNDQTIKNIVADMIYGDSQILSNSGEELSLFNSKGDLVDKVNKWFAGNSKKRATMERKSANQSGINATNWSDSVSSYEGGFGTPKAKNSNFPNPNICLAYDRDDYNHWIDADKNCKDTRVEVLIEESLKEVQMDDCKVISGKWYDSFTGDNYTDPTLLDIDHLVPLKEAHESGAYQWDKEKKKQYANDLEYEHSLLAVYRSVNRSKGAKDPAEWLPPNRDFHKEYAKRWINIKLRWNLSIDQNEYQVLRDLLKDDTKIAFPPIKEEYICKN